MLLTERQQDALTELINISFARAAASLSELVSQRVILEVPKVSIQPVSGLVSEFTSFMPEEITTISQIFKGSISGNALLLLDYDSSIKLMDLLLPSYLLPCYQLDFSSYEILTEVGNILLNACLGIFGNLLQIPLLFSVPLLRLEKVNSLISSLITGKDELRYALVIRTALNLNNNSINAYMVIVSGVPSLHSLLCAIETWAELTIPMKKLKNELIE